MNGSVDQVNPPDDARVVARSVGVAFSVMEAVAQLQPVGVTAIARHLSLPKSTVQRTLRSLESLEFVYRNGEMTTWMLTSRLFIISLRAKALDICDVAMPEMQYLANSSGESVQLTVLDADGLTVLDKVDSSQAVRSHTNRGDRLLIHASSTGKAFLAEASEEFVDQVVARGLERRTERTITDPATLRRELDVIRCQGYAFNDTENRVDVRSIGALVRAANGEPVAGLSVSVPSQRLPVERVPELAKEVVAVADRISTKLGWLAR